MPITDLSNVRTKMFGISMLGAQNELMLPHWKDRFSPSNTFFVPAETTDSAMDIAQKIAGIVRAGKPVMAGERLMLALFLDLGKQLEEASLQSLLGLPEILDEMLYCGTPLIHFFGFVGTLYSADKKLVKENIQRFQKVSAGKHKLWLLADTIQSSEAERWKPAVLFLDFLRRTDAPGALFETAGHTEGTVGLLHYGEFHRSKREALEKEKAQLTYWLNGNTLNDGGTFAELLSDRITALRQALRDAFPVSPDCQPLHPDMFPKGGFLGSNISKAKANKEPFRTARMLSEKAVIATGKGMAQQAVELARKRMGDVHAVLTGLLEKGNVSVRFVEDGADMKDKIRRLYEEPSEAKTLQLPYSGDGYTEPIRRYLEDARACAITTAVNTVLDDLLAAVDRLDMDKLRQRKAELSGRIQSCTDEMSTLPSREMFCDDSFKNGERLFSPLQIRLQINGDSTTRILMCRNPEDRNWINDNVDVSYLSGRVSMCYIDENLGGIIRLDDAPIKCIHAVCSNCTEQRLNDVLRIKGENHG